MAAAERRCEACRRILPELNGPGRPARFCGTACRSAAYRRRRAGVRETAPRWPSPRGHLGLEELAGYAAAQRVARRRRQVRERQARRRRAFRRWARAYRAAYDLGVLSVHVPPRPSAEASIALAELLAAVEECSALDVRGPKSVKRDWDRARWETLELLRLATPPHRTRAERRRLDREARKAAHRLGYPERRS